MFQLDDIKQAHAKVKSSADFPAYVQDLIKLGVVKYDTFVEDGHAVYFGDNDYTVQSNSIYPSLSVSDKSNSEEFIRCLKIHQQGQTDYLTFCSDSATAGIEKWTVDMKSMTCTYYDKANNRILEEKIPVV